MPVAPATIVRTKRSWPGTSTTDSVLPDGSSSLAYPSSIEMPRDRSSSRRSVFTPVSAATRDVFPWSMCPAVPSVSGAQGGAAGVSPLGGHAGRRARAELVGARLEHGEHGDLAAGALWVAVAPQRRLKRGQRQLVESQGPRQRVRARRGNGVRAADHQTGLRAAEQLVAGEADQRGAREYRAAHRRLVAQRGDARCERPRPDVVDHGPAELAQRLDLDLLDETQRA